MPDIKFSDRGTRVDLIRSKKLKLESFNNLTKTLSFNIYDICYAKTEAEQKEYIAYIDEAYNAKRLTAILTDVSCRRARSTDPQSTANRGVVQVS